MYLAGYGPKEKALGSSRLGILPDPSCLCPEQDQLGSATLPKESRDIKTWSPVSGAAKSWWYIQGTA